jgi:hypothetical protein
MTTSAELRASFSATRISGAPVIVQGAFILATREAAKHKSSSSSAHQNGIAYELNAIPLATIADQQFLASAASSGCTS